MLTELEAQIQRTDIRRIRFLRDQIQLRQHIRQVLKKEGNRLTIYDEEQLKNALSIVDDNIQRLRMEGIS